jgi:hypothetical protein
LASGWWENKAFQNQIKAVCAWFDFAYPAPPTCSASHVWASVLWATAHTHGNTHNFAGCKRTIMNAPAQGQVRLRHLLLKFSGLRSTTNGGE